MKTIYFFGAGASKGSDFNLPVMNEFFRGFNPNEFPALADYLRKVFPGHPYKEINLEEAITHLEVSLEGFAALWQPPESVLIQARTQFDDYVRKSLDHANFFSGEPSAGKSNRIACAAHKSLFKMLKEDDSVISLNYDLISDISLRGAPTPILERSYRLMRIDPCGVVLGHQFNLGIKERVFI